MANPAFLWISRPSLLRRPFIDFAGLLACTLAVALLSACGSGRTAHSQGLARANADEGVSVILRDGCGSCHAIPGVANADGQVGPPLTHFARRTSIAGLLPNAPDPLVRWLRFPQSVAPGNAMPNTGLTEQQARDVAAYLYTLR